ncbi:S1/P1 nuclease [Sphingomonas sp. AR_OL41]|uniref:S1/P1 nuclease n=1 Tax=Sphingomonas sp. AR_OL41 TaxID=3042729 RepID=UPI002481359D|nr:S1/P1 nuclease [Sphingomonas sp. AR_OL41]MDH7973213.1 S1/P1 nuclease [Sphingomonas sp. AR_OL41]
MRKSIVAALATLALFPTQALAWGSEGHVLVAAIARARLSPAALAKVDAILAQDHDGSTPSDMLSRAVWADIYRRDHRETAQWHFADVEKDHPDFDAACFGHPSSAGPASTGPETACVIDRTADFARELGDPDTAMAERILALKFVLHFVGDMHQPLHVADNHDRGGNCVLISLGSARTVNLHSYWDTVVIGELGTDARNILTRLSAEITADKAAAWSVGDLASWARETNAVALGTAYSFATQPRCEQSPTPLTFPKGYDEAAQRAAATQIERAGVRLAVVLEKAMRPLNIAGLSPAQ